MKMGTLDICERLHLTVLLNYYSLIKSNFKWALDDDKGLI